MLPYTQVQYIFGTSSVSPALQTYYGCIMGKATILHDLESHGWFPPKNDDCGGDETTQSYNGLTYKDGVISVNPEGTDDRLPYPKFTKGNQVDYSTVKTYFANLKYVSIYEADRQILPLNGTSFRVVEPKLTEKDVSVKTFLFPNSDSTFWRTLSVSDANTLDDYVNREVMVPGTLSISVTLDDAGLSELTLIDKYHEGDKDIMSGVIVPSDSLPAGYVYTGTLRYSYNTDYHAYIFDGAISVTKDGDPVVIADIGPSKCNTASYENTGTLLIGTGAGAGIAIGPRPDLGTQMMDMTDLKEAFLDIDSRTITGDENATVIVKAIRSIDYDLGIVSIDNILGANNYAPREGLAVIHCADSDHPVRFDAKDPSPASTFDSSTGEITLDLSELTFTTRDYDYSLENPYLGYYDTDPSDVVLRPEIPNVPPCNFISGDFRIEYEERVTSAVRINENGLHRTDLLSEDELVSYIGQNDPRNQLGFAYAFVRAITSAEFYVLAYTDLQEAFGTLEKYRNIFHIWNVSDAGPEPKFDTWIDLENQKERSRFRIGYQYRPIDESIIRIQSINATFGVSDSGSYFIEKTGAGFLSTYGVAPNDTVEAVDEYQTYTAYSVTDDKVTFVESYNKDSSYSKHVAAKVDDNQYEYTADHPINAASLWAKIVYVDPVSGALKTREQSSTSAPTDICDIVIDGVKVTVTSRLIPGSDPEATYKVTSVKLAFKCEPYTTTFKIYKVYTSDEKTQHLIDIQSSSNMANVIVLSKDIKYASQYATEEIKSASVTTEDVTFLPNYAIPGLIFGTKLATQPHMPLTLVSFSLPGIGEVMGMRDFSHENLEMLLGAGYCMLNSEVGGDPFCETDCTAGYKYYGDSDRGLLSKITPVLMYGKDVYQVTKDWKGPMNTGTPELISGLGMSLVVLKKKYTEVRYNMLGTLLKRVSDAQIAFDGSYIVITHHISSQDPARYIDNIIYVE